MKVKFSLIDTLSKEQKNELLDLYRNEWWTKDRTKKDVDIIHKKSSCIIGVIDLDTNILIGFSRILTDYFKYAHVYDAIVAPEYRKLGLGKIIMKLIGVKTN